MEFVHGSSESPEINVKTKSQLSGEVSNRREKVEDVENNGHSPSVGDSMAQQLDTMSMVDNGTEGVGNGTKKLEYGAQVEESSGEGTAAKSDDKLLEATSQAKEAEPLTTDKPHDRGKLADTAAKEANEESGTGTMEKLSMDLKIGAQVSKSDEKPQHKVAENRGDPQFRKGVERKENKESSGATGGSYQTIVSKSSLDAKMLKKMEDRQQNTDEEGHKPSGDDLKMDQECDAARRDKTPDDITPKNQPGDENPVSPFSSIDCEESPRVEEHPMIEMKLADDENKKLKEIHFCHLCKINKSNLVFCPCGHKILCEFCGENLKKCVADKCGKAIMQAFKVNYD